MTALCEPVAALGRIDPRLKLGYVAVVSVLSAILVGPWPLGALCALTLLPWPAARPRKTVLWALVAGAGVAVGGTMLSQGFFYGREPRTELLTLAPWLSLCVEGLVYGAVQSLRMIAVASAGIAVSLTTPLGDLVLGLSRLGLPSPLSFAALLALRFLPEVFEQAQRLLIVQQLRGVRGRGPIAAAYRFGLLVPPLLGRMLQSAREVALAAEVRAYTHDRVPSRELRFGAADRWVAAGLGVLVLSGVAAAVLGM